MKTCPGSATLPTYGAVPSTRPDILMAVPNLSLAFCSVANSSHKSQPMVRGARFVALSANAASLENKLSGVWPLPNNLAFQIRYQFGNYPCSYNHLVKAGENVKAAVTECHSALAALEKYGRIDKSDEKLILKLLDAIIDFGKQCEVWNKIVVNTKNPEALRTKASLDDGSVNPFDGVNAQLEVLRKALQGSCVACRPARHISLS